MQKLESSFFFDYGLVIPLHAEAAPFLERLEGKNDIQYGSRKITLGKLKDKSVCVIVSGCGKIKSASAAQLLIDKCPARLYIHYGTAGAISPQLRIGDIVAATDIIEHDFIELFPKKVPPPLHRIDEDLLKVLSSMNSQFVFGRILSGDEDITKTSRKNKLLKMHGGLAVDWESAGFALTCQINHVRHLILRAISDYAHEQTNKEYQENQQIAVRNVVNIILEIIEKTPSRMPHDTPSAIG